MLGYRKYSFLRAHELLSRLHSNLDDMDALKNLQQLLCREIIRAEKKGREIRGNLKAIQRNGGAAGQKKASSLKGRLEKVRKVAYVWRCFGDAIAFAYLSKYALKQSFYSIHSTNPKQGAGFLFEKKGLANEISVVEAMLQEGVPALLTDLTNTIRYGDVCIMVGADPILIEVKSSRNLDKRGKRQKRELEQLDQLFRTDKAENWRGMGSVRRVEFGGGEEKTYVDQLQLTISTAVQKGYCVAEPEPGLYYVVFAPGAPPVSDVLGTLSFKKPWFFFLNTMKNEQAWSPYVPFITSIKDRDHLWAFIRGDIFIVVSVDFEELIDIVRKAGGSAELDLENGEYPLRIEVSGMEGGGLMPSSHLLTRIGLEFVSPSWLIETSIRGIRKRAADILADDLALFPEAKAEENS